MPIQVEIADRLYDYTDEEKAAEAVEDFKATARLDDAAIVAIWNDEQNPLRPELEKVIFDAVDANGPVRRARESVPGGVTLSIE